MVSFDTHIANFCEDTFFRLIPWSINVVVNISAINTSGVVNVGTVDSSSVINIVVVWISGICVGVCVGGVVLGISITLAKMMGITVGAVWVSVSG